VLHPEDRRLADGDVELRLALGLHAEEPGHERPQRPRRLDEQRRLLGRRQRRPATVRLEARREGRVLLGERGAKAPVQRRELLRLVEIAVAKPSDPQREVACLVTRRLTGAAPKRKSVRCQRANS
jgi:hypothetical protein